MSNEPDPIDFVLVALADARGRLVLQERDEFAPADPELWNLPGGAIEAGETPRQAAFRELEEETGVAPDQLPGLTEVARLSKWCTTHQRRERFAVYVAVTELTDDDIHCHEGRQMVFLEPSATAALPLTQALVLALPRVLTSAPYVAAHGRREPRRFAGVLLVDRQGRVLLQERDEHAPIDPERWGIPGGHLDEDEAAREGALRELDEETGVHLDVDDVRELRSLEVYHGHYDSVDTMTVFIATTDLTDADLVCGEGRQVLFVAPDRARDLDLTSTARILLPDYFDRESP